jgi:hypothetical protein
MTFNPRTIFRTSNDVIASLRRLIKTRDHWLPPAKDGLNTRNDRISYSMLDVQRSTFMGLFFSPLRRDFIKPPAPRVAGDLSFPHPFAGVKSVEGMAMSDALFPLTPGKFHPICIFKAS